MITPIVMEESLEEARAKIARVIENEEERIHLDVGDGMFSELLSVSPSDLIGDDFGELEIDVHLLTDDPTEWIEESMLIKPKRIIGQIERMGSQVDFLAKVDGGGLALKITTPIKSLEMDALERCSVVLLLAVPVGTSGSEFDKRVLEKIKELREIYQRDIIIDGGMNDKTSKLVLNAGASEVGSNSYYWKELAK